MSDVSEPTGADLARQMLNIARAEARKKGTAAGRRPPARRRVQRTGGSDPQRVGSVLDQLADAFGWTRPTAGAQVIIRWGELAPDLVRLAEPERYDAETRTLHVRAVSAAAATQLRLTAGRIAADLNERTGAQTVAAVNVLMPGRRTTPGPAGEPGPVPSPAPADVQALRGRADASPGLAAAQNLLASLQDNVPRTPRPSSPLADAPALREPETAFTDAVALQDDLARDTQDAEDVRLRALARARAEKAGRAPVLPRVFDRTA